jgi:hypothetical protein
LAEGGRNPGFATREDGGVGTGDSLQTWDDLDAGGTRADYCDTFLLEIVAVDFVSVKDPSSDLKQVESWTASGRRTSDSTSQNA